MGSGSLVSYVAAITSFKFNHHSCYGVRVGIYHMYWHMHNFSMILACLSACHQTYRCAFHHGSAPCTCMSASSPSNEMMPFNSFSLETVNPMRSSTLMGNGDGSNSPVLTSRSVDH